LRDLGFQTRREAGAGRAESGDRLGGEEFDFEGLFFSESAHAQHAEPDHVSLGVNALHHCVVGGGFFETRRVGEPHFEVVAFGIEPDLFLVGHSSSPFFGLKEACVEYKNLYTSPMKRLVWLGTSLDDLRSFPDEAKREVGYQLNK